MKNTSNYSKNAMLSSVTIVASLALAPQATQWDLMQKDDKSQPSLEKTSSEQNTPESNVQHAGLVNAEDIKASEVKGEQTQDITLTDAKAKEKTENIDGEEGVFIDPAAPKSEKGKLAFDTTEEKAIDFIAAGVSWDKGSEEVTQVSMQIRENGQWSEWNYMAVYPETENEESTKTGSEPLLTNGADAVKVQVFTTSGKPPANLKVNLINPGVASTDSNIAEQVKDATPIVAQRTSSYSSLNGDPVVNLASSITPATADSIKPAIVTRSAWGANESLVTPSAQSSKLSALYLHHTAGTNNYTQAQSVQQVRSIVLYHTTILDWGDIGYHFLIDKYGTIYEGRRGAISSLPIGAQAGGFNTNTMGISAIGNYDEVAPSSALIESIEKVAAWKSAKHGLNINSTTTLTSGGNQKYAAGARVNVSTFTPHQATSYTACPGRYLLSKMPSMRANAAKAVANGSGSSSGSTTTTPPKNTTSAKTYTVQPGDGWWLISYKTGVSANTLYSLNGMSSSTMLYPGMVLKTSATTSTPAPTQKAPKPSTGSSGTGSTYTVKSGDGWWLISYRTGVPVSTLYSLNGMSSSTILHPGMVLKTSSGSSSTTTSTPSKSTTSSSSKKTTSTPKTYTVKPGDGWWVIASNTGVSASTIQKLNGMSSNTVLHPGMVLKVSSGSNTTTSPKKTTTTPTKKATTKTYTVKPGDGWWVISYRTGVPTSTIQKLNGMSASSMLYPNMVLKLN